MRVVWTVLVTVRYVGDWFLFTNCGDHIALCSMLTLVVVMVKCNGLGNVTVPACSWLTTFSAWLPNFVSRYTLTAVCVNCIFKQITYHL